MERLVVYCADIGSIKQGNFGWARSTAPASDVHQEYGYTEIVGLVDAVSGDLADGLPVALGFECPVFVPVPEDPLLLGAARRGDGARSFSAGAGASALTTGAVQYAWLLSELRRRRPDESVFFDWVAFETAASGLFLWEAFVTDEAKAETHAGDAAVAVAWFTAALPDPRRANAVEAERPFSLLGAAALWAGWTEDISLLRQPCLVLKGAARTDID